MIYWNENLPKNTSNFYPGSKLFAIPFLNQRDLQFLLFLSLLLFLFSLQIIPFNCDRWEASFSDWSDLNIWIIYISFQVISRIKYLSTRSTIISFPNSQHFSNNFEREVLFERGEGRIKRGGELDSLIWFPLRFLSFLPFFADRLLSIVTDRCFRKISVPGRSLGKAGHDPIGHEAKTAGIYKILGTARLTFFWSLEGSD